MNQIISSEQFFFLSKWYLWSPVDGTWLTLRFQNTPTKYHTKKDHKVLLFPFASDAQMPSDSTAWGRSMVQMPLFIDWRDGFMSCPCFVAQMLTSVLWTWTAAIGACQPASTQKGAMSVNAWKAMLEMESIAMVWAGGRPLLCLEGWGLPAFFIPSSLFEVWQPQQLINMQSLWLSVNISSQCLHCF